MGRDIVDALLVEVFVTLYTLKGFYRNGVMEEEEWKKINTCAICQVVFNLVAIWGVFIG